MSEEWKAGMYLYRYEDGWKEEDGETFPVPIRKEFRVARVTPSGVWMVPARFYAVMEEHVSRMPYDSVGAFTKATVNVPALQFGNWWIVKQYRKQRRMMYTCYKRTKYPYASRTIEEARQAYLLRKQYHVQWAEYRYENAKKYLAAAKEMCGYDEEAIASSFSE